MKVANYEVNDDALPIRRLIAYIHCPKTPGLRIVNNSPGGGRQDSGLRLSHDLICQVTHVAEPQPYPPSLEQPSWYTYRGSHALGLYITSPASSGSCSPLFNQILSVICLFWRTSTVVGVLKLLIINQIIYLANLLEEVLPYVRATYAEILGTRSQQIFIRRSRLTETNNSSEYSGVSHRGSS